MSSSLHIFKLKISRTISRALFLLANGLLVLGLASSAHAQHQRGVVWEIPQDFREAAGDLLEMHEVGIEAVRTTMVFDDGLLSLADSLGLVLYRELPFRSLTGRSLRDSLAVADSLVLLLLETGSGHSSAGPVGLTQFSDTSSDVACDELERMASLIRETGGESYYITSFVEDDRCHDRMDFVLLDALEEEDPFGKLGEWRERHETRAGLARIGLHVEKDARSGFEIEGSPEAQARFFETAFNQTEATDGRTVFFIHRWRDESGTGQHVPDPFARQYGLYTVDSDPRPALQVVRGMFLGLQTTFAFDRGVQEEDSLPWFSLLGWLLLALTALMYAASPRFRSMIPRYFFAHGFFRNAVREAREVLPLTSTAILTITGLSIGLIGSFVIKSLQETDLVLHLFQVLSQTARVSVTSTLGAPFILAILMGSIALIAMSLWMGLWMIVSGRRVPLLPSQALMLAVWPRWQVLFLLPLAMTLAAAESVPIWAVILLAAGWLGAAYWSTARTAYDLFKITSIQMGWAFAVWLLNPLIFGSVVLFGWAVLNADDASFVWHLMVRH